VSNKGLVLFAGAAFGLMGALLVKSGNPGNMGYSAGCFLRDIAGALGWHKTATVQYLRPEILGFVLGAFIIALPNGEFRSRGGSAPVVRFVLGALMMIGALMFLGCPLRGILRLGGGDFNALTGLAGFTGGVGLGTYFLRNGFNLGRSHMLQNQVGGYIMPVIAIILLVFLVTKPAFIYFSAKGPGSIHAPILLSLTAGMVGGVLAQRTRLCLSGGIRDFLLVRDTTLLSSYGVMLLAAFGANFALGQVKWGFTGQPLAHSMHLWNFLGLFLCGFAAVLAGGCPFRQLILAGEGNLDGVVTVVGMVTGAALAHKFLLASSPSGATAAGQIVTVAGIGIVSAMGFFYRETLTLSREV
jgi:uncharacterized protein